MNWLLLKNSFLVSAAATLLAVCLGALAALWTAGANQRVRGRITAAAIVALVMPPFVVTNCWIDLLGQNGILREWLSWDIYSLPGTVGLLALLTWPIAFLFVSAALRRLEQSQLEVDDLLQGTALIRWLLLPMGGATLGQSAVLTFVLALNNFAVPAILQVKVVPAEVWVGFNTTFDYASALKLCWPMIVVPMLAVGLFYRKTIRWTWRAETVPAVIFRKKLGPCWSGLGKGVAFFLVFFSVLLPLGQLLINLATWTELGAAYAAGQSALLHSVGFALATATLVVVFALLTWRLPLGWLLWIPFFVPGVLLGIAVIWIFNRPGLDAIYQSVAVVILAYFIRYAALGWNGVARATRSVDPILSDAARLEGASRWQMMRHVYWPQISTQVAAAWYITFLLCLWDVEALVLIVPPGSESIALRIFNLLHYGHNAQVNALCLLLLVVALLPLLCWKAVKAFGHQSPLLVSCALVCLLFTGCSDSHPKGLELKSHFFSEVQVIGSRGTGLGQFNKPRSVAVDAQDNLYVMDMTGRLQKFSPDGVFLNSWMMPQTEKGKPKGMCCDRMGNIVVVEPHYTRVNHFTPEGKLALQWGVNGTNVGQLAFPRAAAVNSKNDIYVSEYSLVERVQRFSAIGKNYLGSFGKPGPGPGELDRAEGICIDSKDNVFVADSCNHRIQVFTGEGTFLRSYGKAGAGVGELSYPYDIRVDSTGLQFVCEFGNSRIQIFDGADKSIEILGAAGAEPGQFANPWAICLDSKGNLYVADSQNHRVQKFLRKATIAVAPIGNRVAPRPSRCKRLVVLTYRRLVTGFTLCNTNVWPTASRRYSRLPIGATTQT